MHNLLATTNYIQTANPFNLAAPPPSFLLDLATYDDRLVVFPSNAEPVYRLCRRVTGTMPWQRFPPNHLDNPVMFENRMVPIKAIFPQPQWGQVILKALVGCDVQRVGGGIAAAEILDESEQLEERRLDASIADQASYMAGEAYRGLKAQFGQTVFSGMKRPEGPGGLKNPFEPKMTSKRRPVYRPRGSGEHAIFTGR
jgi:hypothetical protein